ncbi:MAG: tRNA lysidine(34) synthetase TilS [Verrucomicrobiaceae bacterium]|nr:tRNA lysidine(34) synthetase TilS [Verrucomicrobiaceae bacterium]
MLACLPHGKALLGLSGGRDSVALLHLLLAAGCRELILCHLNHHLRGAESDADAEFVRELARKMALPCEIAKTNVKGLAKRKKLSLETAAREARHAFFRRMSRKHGTQAVLLAHHADDQAETILGNVLRGCGLDGLGGMRLSTVLEDGLLLLRPLLLTTRAQIDAYLASHRLKWRDDSSNDSAEYRRNRLRHEALPLLSDVAGREVAPLLNRLGSLAAQDEACLNRLASAELATFQRPDGLHDLRRLSTLDPALLSRLLAIWMRDSLRLSGIGFDEIQRAMHMLAPGGPAKINLPGGHHLRRKAGRLWLE